jgi:hypothetical protein
MESRKRPRAEEAEPAAAEAQPPAEEATEEAAEGAAEGATEGGAAAAAAGVEEEEEEEEEEGLSQAKEKEEKEEEEEAPGPPQKDGDAEEEEDEEAAPKIVIAPLVSSLAGIAGQPYLAALHGKAVISSSVVKKLNTLDPAAASIGAAPTFLVAKATECFLATVIAEGVKASAARARAAPEDSAARKKPRLTYDDVRAAALSLKDAGLLANVAFLNRVLPLRTEEDPKPEPRAPKTEGATGAALAAAGAAPAEGAAASAAAVAAE